MCRDAAKSARHRGSRAARRTRRGLRRSSIARDYAPRSDAARATLTAKTVIVAEVERLRWRIWNGKAKNARRSIERIRKIMHVFKGERGASPS
jgi:hypothetical protein